MLRSWAHSVFFVCSFLACSIMALTTGCASGGFKLTRQYAGWVNSQHIIIRIILYLLTSVVFAATLLIDFVIFNTMDFWEGRVSAGSYEFKDGGKTYHVRHEFQNGTKLKRSTIEVIDASQTRLQEVVLNETVSGEIEMFIDGKLRTRVHGLSELPVATTFDVNGTQVDQHVVLIAPTMAAGARN